MGLNIVAHRKVSLKGFAEGWDDCYIRVRTVSEKTRKAWLQKMNAAEEAGDKADEIAEQTTRDACLDVIVGGLILNTDEDGNEAPYEFTREDVPAVVDALNFAWQGEVVSIATGADRLKATLSSL